MKFQAKSTIVKSVFSLLFALVLTTTVTANNNPGIVSPNAAKISFNGQQNDKLQFKVEYKNDQETPFTLIVKSDLNTLYTRKFEAKPLNLDLFFADVPEDCDLTFIIKHADKESTQKFQVKKQTRSIVEFVVKGAE